jgi:hypothetical protein
MVVQPQSPSPELTETLSRVHGELLSVGLNVELVTRAAPRGTNGPSPRTWLEALAAEREIDAVIDIVLGETPAAVDIWVFERNPSRAEVTRVATEPNAENAPLRLAIRAIEVLRSLLIEHHLLLEAAPPPPSLSTRAEPARPPEPSRRFGVELGAALLASLDGLGPAFVPLVRVNWEARSWLVLQGELAGPGTRATVSASGASAAVAQQYAVVGGCACGASSRRLRPIFALSAGVLRTSADGHADSPLQPHTIGKWSFLLQASVGARLRLHGRYDLTFAAEAQIAHPYVAIFLLDTIAGTAGRPNVLATLTLGGWL